MKKNMFVFSIFAIFQILDAAAPTNLNQAEAQLADAVIQNDIDKVKKLLAIPGINPDAPNSDGMTTLMKVHSKDIAELLLQAGANVNAQAVWGLTPLMNVRNMDLAELFLAYGADASIENKYGRTAEDLLRGTFHSDIADFIRDYKPTLIKGSRKQ